MTRPLLKRLAFAVPGMLLGVPIPFLVIRLAVATGGGGLAMNNDVFTWFLPYSELLLATEWPPAIIASLIVGFAQFPLYGYMLGDAASFGMMKFTKIAFWIGLCHGLAAAVLLVVIMLTTAH